MAEINSAVDRETIVELTIASFSLLEKKGEKEVIDWCMNFGLLPSKCECPKCGQNMRLCARKGAIDGYEWRCRTKKDNVHDTTRSIRTNSWFANSRSSLCDILIITRFWFGRCYLEFAMNELKTNNHIISERYALCREVCTVDVMNNSKQIGGKDIIVEIKLFTLGKIDSVASQFPQGKWVYGGIEKGTKKYFFEVCEGNEKDDIYKVIKNWVLPGSIVISDFWKTYDWVSDDSFRDLVITDGLTFKDPVNAADSDGIWMGSKRFLRHNLYHVEGEFDFYFGEYMWRKIHDHSMSDSVFKSFLDAAALLCRPVERM